MSIWPHVQPPGAQFSQHHHDSTYDGHDYTGPSAHHPSLEMEPFKQQMDAPVYDGQRQHGEAQGYYTGAPPNNQQYGQQQYGQYAQQPQQQQYMPNPPAYGQNYGNDGPSYGSDGKNTFDQQFKVEKPKWNDLWAGILLIVVFLGFVAVSGITISGYAGNKGFNGGGIYGSENDFSLNTNTIVLFCFMLATALILGYGYICLARMFTKAFIWITGILNICLTLATAIYYFYRHAWVGGAIWLAIGLFTIFCFVTWIKRIPFAVLMFQTAVDVSRKVGHVYLVSFLGGLVALVSLTADSLLF